MPLQKTFVMHFSVLHFKVLADKIYTSNEFKKVKENFTVSFDDRVAQLVFDNFHQSIAKNLENSEVKEWLESTKVIKVIMKFCFNYEEATLSLFCFE